MKEYRKGDKRGHFTFIESKEIYKNPWTTFYEDTVIRPDGKEEHYGITDIGDGVTVLGVSEEKEVYLLKGYLYAVDREMYLTASGNVEEGETPLEAAKRELLEEAGLISDNWIDAGEASGSPNLIKNTDKLFLALDAKEVAATDPDFESLTLHKFPLEEAYQMIVRGEMTYAFATVLILRAYLYFQKHES